ncbi:MAG: type II secretion system GspH family protein [Lachnospiraceae bacterium]|nr:type II secretion system GspH family protein [Lachnospiraceae bacterium]
MKKMNNKGFSMVELIIVIAIMAILAGALAPTLIKYVNKSRMSSDVSNAQTIAGAVQTAYSDTSSYDSVGMISSGTMYTVPQLMSNFSNFSSNFSTTLGAAVSVKYTKKTSDNKTPDQFGVKITTTGGNVEVKVYANTAGDIELYPTVHSDYDK